jgi:hypothetical protein
MSHFPSPAIFSRPALSLHRFRVPHPLRCPACRTVLVEVFQDGLQTQRGRDWLQNSEALPELTALLQSQVAAPITLYTGVDLGTCPTCAARYGVPELKVIHARVDSTFMEMYLSDGPPGPLHLAGVTHLAVAGPWIASQHLTRLGVLHHHVFGPFPLHALRLTTETILISLWPALHDFARQQRPWPPVGIRRAARLPHLVQQWDDVMDPAF